MCLVLPNESDVCTIVVRRAASAESLTCNSKGGLGSALGGHGRKTRVGPLWLYFFPDLCCHPCIMSGPTDTDTETSIDRLCVYAGGDQPTVSSAYGPAVVPVELRDGAND